jgi:hypothetical protein
VSVTSTVDERASTTGHAGALVTPRTVQQLRARLATSSGGVAERRSGMNDPVGATRTLCVAGAHPGAGTTTVAVALADALTCAVPNLAIALIDPHAATASGLVCAADRELGPTDEAWLLGQRGSVGVYRRPATGTPAPDAAELPPFNHGVQRTWVVVVDGHTTPTDQPVSKGRAPVYEPIPVVLVCRASVPGVRHAEISLHDVALRSQPVVVLVGERRLPAVAKAALGPRLRELYESNRTVSMPGHRRLAVEGIDDRPLPSCVLRAGLAILRLTCPDLLNQPTAARSGVPR